MKWNVDQKRFYGSKQGFTFLIQLLVPECDLLRPDFSGVGPFSGSSSHAATSVVIDPRW